MKTSWETDKAAKKCPKCGDEIVYDHFLKLMVHKLGGNVYCIYGQVERDTE
jgi:hypothetical protein